MVQRERVRVFTELQSEILRLLGMHSHHNPDLDESLGPIAHAFPNATFPLASVHEFLSPNQENAAATSGFMAGLLSVLMGTAGTCLWISASRTLFPPSLKSFGIQPDHLIFIDLAKEKDVIWAMDEALKCGALTAVVGEVSDIDFTSSRRLQLAVERSKVTGFIMRKGSRPVSTTACVSRWRITSLNSEPIDDLPGVGYPRWKIELLRMRNGKPGTWQMEWRGGKFVETLPGFDATQGDEDHITRQAI